MSTGIFAEAAAFDDEALAALANAGLIRRAAKLTAEIDTESLSDDRVEVGVDTETVSFQLGVGLSKGSCSCPTVGPCQHVVAAILKLRSNTPTAPAAAVGDSPETESVQDWLLALDDTELQRFSGKPSLRWAVARVDEMELEHARVDEGPPFVVSTPFGVTVRFMARGLESAFCEPATPNDRREIALAALIVRVRAGMSLPTIGSAKGSQAKNVSGRSELCHSVLTATQDATAIGIAHLSPVFSERFDALAVGARGVKLYRTAQLCARVSTEVDQLAERSASADAGVLLEDLGLLHTVTELLLELIDAGHEPPTWLAGTARTEYRPAGTLDVLALGASPWQTMSGYSGITGVFFDIANNRFLEMGVARPDAQAGNASGYNEHLGWSGSVSLESIAGCRVTLVNTLVNDQGRVSGSSQTTAMTGSRWNAEDLRSAEWGGTGPAAGSRLRGGRGSIWSCLKIQDFGPTHFDEVRQRLIAPITAAEREVVLSTDWSDTNAPIIGAVEDLSRQQPSHIIGRLFQDGDQLALMPVSALVAGQLQVLAFDRAKPARSASRRNRKGLQRLVPHDRPLEAIGASVLELAERGTDEHSTPALLRIGERAGRYGFAALSAAISNDGTAPTARLLRAAHLLAEYRSQRGRNF